MKSYLAFYSVVPAPPFPKNLRPREQEAVVQANTHGEAQAQVKETQRAAGEPVWGITSRYLEGTR